MQVQVFEDFPAGTAEAGLAERLEAYINSRPPPQRRPVNSRVRRDVHRDLKRLAIVDNVLEIFQDGKVGDVPLTPPPPRRIYNKNKSLPPTPKSPGLSSLGSTPATIATTKSSRTPANNTVMMSAQEDELIKMIEQYIQEVENYTSDTDDDYDEDEDEDDEDREEDRKAAMYRRTSKALTRILTGPYGTGSSSSGVAADPIVRQILTALRDRYSVDPRQRFLRRGSTTSTAASSVASSKRSDRRTQAERSAHAEMLWDAAQQRKSVAPPVPRIPSMYVRGHATVGLTTDGRSKNGDGDLPVPLAAGTTARSQAPPAAHGRQPSRIKRSDSSKNAAVNLPPLTLELSDSKRANHRTHEALAPASGTLSTTQTSDAAACTRQESTTHSRSILKAQVAPLRLVEKGPSSGPAAAKAETPVATKVARGDSLGNGVGLNRSASTTTTAPSSKAAALSRAQSSSNHRTVPPQILSRATSSPVGGAIIDSSAAPQSRYDHYHSPCGATRITRRPTTTTATAAAAASQTQTQAQPRMMILNQSGGHAVGHGHGHGRHHSELSASAVSEFFAQSQAREASGEIYAHPNITPWVKERAMHERLEKQQQQQRIPQAAAATAGGGVSSQRSLSIDSANLHYHASGRQYHSGGSNKPAVGKN